MPIRPTIRCPNCDGRGQRWHIVRDENEMPLRAEISFCPDHQPYTVPPPPKRPVVKRVTPTERESAGQRRLDEDGSA